MTLNLNNMQHVVQSPKANSKEQMAWLEAHTKAKWVRTRTEHYKGIYGPEAKQRWKADYAGILHKQEFYRSEAKRLSTEEWLSIYFDGDDGNAILTLNDKMNAAKEELERLVVIYFADGDDAMLYKLTWCKT